MFTIKPIFPTPLVISNIGRQLSDEELLFCDINKLTTNKNEQNIYSSDVYVLDNPKLSSIRQYIESAIDYYVEFILCSVDSVKFYITQSWFNYTDLSQSHHIHAHSNSIISGVFYFNADPLYDSISFKDMSYEQISIMPKQWNIFNTKGYNHSVTTGDLVLFPSKLFHSVSPTKKDHTRISLAFNVFAKGEIGDSSKLNSLVL